MSAMSPVERFHASYEMVTESGCWIWMKQVHRGYGYFNIGGRHPRAHRWIYAQLHGAIPSELECDHLCGVRCCVNPSHIRLVSHKINNLASNSPVGINSRKTHCYKGHPLTPGNLVVITTRPTWRICLECNRQRNREQRVGGKRKCQTQP